MIDDKRIELLRIPTLNRALQWIKREAYIHHVYHNAAIEGNTLTLDQVRFILETKLAIPGLYRNESRIDLFLSF